MAKEQKLFASPEWSSTNQRDRLKAWLMCARPLCVCLFLSFFSSCLMFICFAFTILLFIPSGGTWQRENRLGRLGRGGELMELEKLQTCRPRLLLFFTNTLHWISAFSNVYKPSPTQIEIDGKSSSSSQSFLKSISALVLCNLMEGDK